MHGTLTSNKMGWLYSSLMYQDMILPTDSLQSMNALIWSEWLPTLKGYSLAGNYSLETYGPPTENPEDYESYIWITLKTEL